MLFRSLKVTNFRAIKSFEVDNLSDFVMIAGPNGCGKTCVFDAIRLLKSLYGGYHPNEWQQFFAELQIDINRPSDFPRLYRDATLPFSISATVELNDAERAYLDANAEAVLEPHIWTSVAGQESSQGRFAAMAMAAQHPERAAEVRSTLDRRVPEFRSELSQSIHHIAISLDPGNFRINVATNQVIALLFSTYDPEHLGVVEYHSASRAYQREALGGVDLNARNFEDQRRQSTIFNVQNKYSNIKAELAASHLRDMIDEKADREPARQGINDTVSEMFAQFFPSKSYLGIRAEPGGPLTFPVQLSSGEIHDIDELSSGEKELVYGYLRLKNSTPRYSTILIDEPELHLNPKLLRGLVQFYHENLGAGQGNQLWLVTHSDALLRQAIRNSSYSVYHMTPVQGLDAEHENQAVRVLADDDLKNATMALVGDLASYKPSGRVVIVEGGGDSEFDATTIAALAPDFAQRVNIVSGGDKRGVRTLHKALESTGSSLGAAGRYFAIVDRDFDQSERPDGTHTSAGTFTI